MCVTSFSSQIYLQFYKHHFLLDLMKVMRPYIPLLLLVHQYLVFIMLGLHTSSMYHEPP